MLTDKEATAKIHHLATQYSQNSALSHAFFGGLDDIYKAQRDIAKQLLNTKNTTHVVTVLEQKILIEGKTITNSDLLRQHSGYLSLRLFYGLFYILTFPFSLPILLSWSRIRRGSINFIKTDGTLLVEKIQELCQSVSTILPQHENPSHHQHISVYSHFRTHMASSLMWHRTNNLLKPTNNMLSSLTSGFYATKKFNKDSIALLNDAISNCERQEEHHIHDLVIITEAITQFEQEQTFLNKQMQAQQKPCKQADINSSSSPQVNAHDWDEPMGKRECNDMLRQYHELMNAYPKYLEGDQPTLDGVQSYHAASEAHHEKVLAIAERLVPELYNLLRQGRFNASRITNSALT